MAIYHLSVKPVSRSGGRSATAAAAYRAADRIQDVATGDVFDYSRKRGVEHSEIILPTSAIQRDINWAYDREALWNAAEATEKRKDARVAREYELALPHELGRLERIELVRAFARTIADRYGVAVDFSLHRPHWEGDQRNFHAHVLATTRQVTPTGLGEKATLEWSDADRAKKGLPPGKEVVKGIRGYWAGLTNEHLRNLEIDARIDHRTLEAQGIDRIPTVHVGPAVEGLERRGVESDVNRRIREQQLEAAQARIERAAELGRLEIARREVMDSIIDVSGNLAEARRERHRQDFRALDVTLGDADLYARDFERESMYGESAPRSARKRPTIPQELESPLDRYLTANADAIRADRSGVSVSEAQRRAIRESRTELERVRPGAARDLFEAAQHHPGLIDVLTQKSGRERNEALYAGLEDETRMRADPRYKAIRMAMMWERLEVRHGQCATLADLDKREAIETRLRSMAHELKRDPQLESLMRERRKELGIGIGSHLGRVIDAPTIEDALALPARVRGLSR